MSSAISAAKRILRYRPPLALAVAGCVATAWAAWLWPLSPPADLQDVRDAFDAPLPGKSAPEDLTAFLASTRWGRSLAERREQTTNPAAETVVSPSGSAINPELARVGLFGVTLHAGEYAVLIALPDDRTRRLHPGDVLRDGRTLVAVDGNSVTLRDSMGAQAKLVLFPRASAAPAHDDAGTSAPAPAPTPEGEASSQ